MTKTPANGTRLHIRSYSLYYSLLTIDVPPSLSTYTNGVAPLYLAPLATILQKIATITGRLRATRIDYAHAVYTVAEEITFNDWVCQFYASPDLT